MKTLFRIDGVVSVSIDEYDDITGHQYNLYTREYEVIKETKCGYWIDVYGDKKWVSKTSRKRYAYPSVHEAYDNFIKRKKRQSQIMKSRLKDIEIFIKRAEFALKQYENVNITTA